MFVLSLVISLYSDSRMTAHFGLFWQGQQQQLREALKDVRVAVSRRTNWRREIRLSATIATGPPTTPPPTDPPRSLLWRQERASDIRAPAVQGSLGKSS